MFQKHKEKLNKKLIRTLNISSFMLGISVALVMYIESDYFKTATLSENVTAYFILAYFFALLLIFNWHRLIKKFGEKKVFLANLLAEAFFVFVLAALPVGKVGVFFLMIYIVSVSLTWIDIDILLEAGSRDHKTGRIRGAYLTIMNAGLLVAPFFAGLLIQKWSFQPVFLAASFLVFIVWSICFWKVPDFDKLPVKKSSFFELLKKIRKRKNILRVYYVSFLLEFFYALMVVYTPLYLLELGFSWAKIGQIFTIMLLPFVLFQYPAGYLADKKFEERDMIIFSLLVMTVSSGALFFVSSNNFFIWAVLLFCTRIGASLIEVLRDSYFYKRVDSSEVDVIDFFRSVRPAGNILGLAIATPVVFFFNIRSVFLLIAIVAFSGIFVAKKMEISRAICRVKK